MTSVVPCLGEALHVGVIEFFLNFYLLSHESARRIFAGPSESSHPRSGDEVEILPALRIEEGHLADGLVVGGHAEGDDLQRPQPRRHRERLSAVSRLVEVLLGQVWMRHAGGISTHDVEVGSGAHP